MTRPGVCCECFFDRALCDSNLPETSWVESSRGPCSPIRATRRTLFFVRDFRSRHLHASFAFFALAFTSLLRGAWDIPQLYVVKLVLRGGLFPCRSSGFHTLWRALLQFGKCLADCLIVPCASFGVYSWVCVWSKGVQALEARSASNDHRETEKYEFLHRLQWERGRCIHIFMYTI